MEEHFILRVPPSIAQRLDQVLSENALSNGDNSIDLSFEEDGRTGSFVIGNDRFPAALLDLPCVVESYKTYDDTVLIKAADIGQIIMVREDVDPPPEGPECRHGLTPPMHDARRRRFRREPDLNPEVVQKVENELVEIMAREKSQTDFEVLEQEEEVEDEQENAQPVANPSSSPPKLAIEPPQREDKSDSDDYD